VILKEHSGYKFVELYVGMGKLVAWWHQFALGFELKGKRIHKGMFGEEITYWLQQGKANLLITSAMEPAAHDVVSFVDRHGNSIKRFAVSVENIELAFEHAKKHQAIFLSSIEHIAVQDEQAKIFRVKLFDDNEIMYVESSNTFGPLPGFMPINETQTVTENHIQGIDHLASVVRMNESNYWNQYMANNLALTHIQTIGEEFFANLLTGMKMNVFSSQIAKINKVIVEPLPDKSKKSQVDVFLQHNLGTGIQHLAFEVDDLISVVSKFKEKGIQFNPVPEAYYEELLKEMPELPIEQMKENGILCEKDDDKLLLQVFTEPIGDRPTLFYEFVQRVNDYDGFGAKNVHQLFKSLEVQLNGNN
jgi:4-hydroxyphenylpyruvate dioxygenase